MSVNKKVTVKLHKCQEPNCDASFTKPSRLKDHHVSKHLGLASYKCSYQDCPKSYTSSSHLKRHVVTAHIEEGIPTPKEVICDESNCGKCFSNKYSLQKHKKRFHCSDSLLFKCTQCNQGFKKKSLLNSHMVTAHGAEGLYKCDQCSLSFVLYHAFMKHKKNHKTYQCDCGEEFQRWTKLCEHKRAFCQEKAKEYKCVICEKIFLRKQALTEHSLVHIEDSQLEIFRCPYLNCNKSYKYKKNLLFHIKTYHQKFFDRIECPKEGCEVVLKSNKNLKQHLRVCHNKLPEKQRKSRKPRKDKGVQKKSFASIISGFEVSSRENIENIENNPDSLETESVDKLQIIIENDKQLNESIHNSDIEKTVDEVVTSQDNSAIIQDGSIIFDFPELVDIQC
ncbi:hypothetical protein GWI33_010540 [Rhynchophorus ferrugineus]|uniref:C2H2-type domain-containing protein n=1 Tax=Rhynchophorus ferrugineus TaxID=354439 RepID=A0A834IUZ4_RHYFE|nr:hypothetical protein GWI33_010540 [Rhynchophorus ferrugineus]